MLSAMATLSGGNGALAYPSVATDSVMLWATVKAVMVLSSRIPARNDQQQSQYKQQMVHTQHDVLDTQLHIRCRSLPLPRSTMYHERQTQRA